MITMQDLEKWIDDCIKDSENFQTKSLDPETERAKSMILKIIRKMKGRID